MTIFYAQYCAEPLPSSEQFEICGGAYVCCWVEAQSENEALKIMSAAINGAGWKVLALEDECRKVEELSYSEDPEGKEYFAQAVTDGGCYVFHQWPIEPQEGDNVH